MNNEKSSNVVMSSENTVKIGISFESLLEAISSLAIPQKRKLWELLETELFQHEEEEGKVKIIRKQLQKSRLPAQTIRQAIISP